MIVIIFVYKYKSIFCYNIIMKLHEHSIDELNLFKSKIISELNKSNDTKHIEFLNVLYIKCISALYSKYKIV